MIPTATINRKVSGGGGKEKRTKKASSIDPKSRASIVSSIRRGTRKGKAKISRRSFVSTTSHQPATFALNEEPVWCVALWPPQTIHCPRWGPRVSNPIRDGKSRWIGRSADFSPRPLHNGQPPIFERRKRKIEANWWMKRWLQEFSKFYASFKF